MGLSHPDPSGESLPATRPTVINMPKARAAALQRVVSMLNHLDATGFHIQISKDDRFALLELATQLQYAQRNPRDPSELLTIPTELVLHFGWHVQDYVDPDIDAMQLYRSEIEGMQSLMSSMIKEFGPCDHSVGICYCDLQRTYDQLSDLLNRPSAEPSLTVTLAGDEGYDAIVGREANPEEEELK